MAADPNQQSPNLAGRVNFQDLKTWIAAQEAYEAATGQPAPLTAAQQKALAQLKLPSVAPRQGVDLVGDNDWISLIHRYGDAHHSLRVVIEFTDTPGPDNQWLATCAFSDVASPVPTVFPGPGTGFVQLDNLPGVASGHGPPGFARKRDARQYAARCCAEWLMAASRIPQGGNDVVFPRESAAAMAAAAANGTAALSSSSQPSSPPPPLSPIRFAGTMSVPGPGVDADMSFTQRAAEMCRRLRMPPPRYELTPSDGIDGPVDGYWSGAAHFGNCVFMPEEVGRVDRIYGKKTAKEKIAEEVLAHLSRIYATRRAEHNAATGDSGAKLEADDG